MSDWQQCDLKSLVPGQVQQAVDTVGTLSDTASTGLKSAAGGLKVLSSLIVETNDPLSAAINDITSRIDSLVDIVFNTLQTGVYFYADGGPLITGGEPDGLPGFISRLDASLRDPGDDMRPQFRDSSQVEAVILCAGAESIPNLLPMLELMGELFGVQKFKDASERLAKAHNTLPEEIYWSMPSPPDWQAGKVRDYLPPLAGVEEILEQILGMTRTARGVGDFLGEVVQILEEKANILLEMADETKRLADSLETLIATPGLNGLHIKTNDGNEGFIKEIKQAKSPPPWHYDSWVVGVVLLGGSGDFAKIPALFGF